MSTCQFCDYSEPDMTGELCPECQYAADHGHLKKCDACGEWFVEQPANVLRIQTVDCGCPQGITLDDALELNTHLRMMRCPDPAGIKTHLGTDYII